MKRLWVYFVLFFSFSISTAPLPTSLFKSVKIVPLLYWRPLNGILSCTLTKRNIKGGKEGALKCFPFRSFCAKHNDRWHKNRSQRVEKGGHRWGKISQKKSVVRCQLVHCNILTEPTWSEAAAVPHWHDGWKSATQSQCQRQKKKKKQNGSGDAASMRENDLRVKIKRSQWVKKWF